MNRKYVWIGILVVTIALSLVGTVAGEVYVISGNWENETVESSGNTGWYPSIDTDSSNYPHIAYIDSSNSDLKYAKWNGTDWVIEIADNSGCYYDADTDMPTVSMQLDSNDYAHIAYLDYTGTRELKYTKWNGTGWETTVLTAGYYAHSPSLVLDSNDYPHIAYTRYEGGLPEVHRVMYSIWNGTGWETENVTGLTTDSRGVSLDLDSNDNSYIVNVKHVSAVERHMLYTKKINGSWLPSPETIESVYDLRFPNIAVDSNQKTHLVYGYWDPSGVTYATNKDGSWVKTYLSSDATMASITLDIYNNPYIVFDHDDPNNARELIFAYYDGYTWYGEIATDENAYMYGGMDIVVDSDFTIHTACLDYSDGLDLIYATYNLTYMEWSKGIYGNVYLLPLYTAGKDTDIICKNDTFSTSTTANTTGYYIFDNLAAGFYWINATLHSYIDNNALVEVVEGYNQTLLSGCDAL